MRRKDNRTASQVALSPSTQVGEAVEDWNLARFGFHILQKKCARHELPVFFKWRNILTVLSL